MVVTHEIIMTSSVHGQKQNDRLTVRIKTDKASFKQARYDIQKICLIMKSDEVSSNLNFHFKIFFSVYFLLDCRDRIGP